MTNFEAQQADHYEHLRQVEREDAIAQLVAAAERAWQKAKREYDRVALWEHGETVSDPTECWAEFEGLLYALEAWRLVDTSNR